MPSNILSLNSIVDVHNVIGGNSDELITDIRVTNVYNIMIVQALGAHPAAAKLTRFWDRFKLALTTTGPCLFLAVISQILLLREMITSLNNSASPPPPCYPTIAVRVTSLLVFYLAMSPIFVNAIAASHYCFTPKLLTVDGKEIQNTPTFPQRLMLWFMCVFVEYIMFFAVCAVGTWYLLASASGKDLVVDVLAVTFVMEIDEIFAAMFLLKHFEVEQQVCAKMVVKETSKSKKRLRYYLTRFHIIVLLFMATAIVVSFSYFSDKPSCSIDTNGTMVSPTLSSVMGGSGTLFAIWIIVMKIQKMKKNRQNSQKELEKKKKTSQIYPDSETDDEDHSETSEVEIETNFPDGPSSYVSRDNSLSL